MKTIAENLLALQQTKENFKTAFAEKEVDLTDVPFTEYPNKFAEIKTSEDLDTELAKQEEILSELETEANALSDKGDFDVESVVDEASGTQVLIVNGKNDAVEPLDITQNGEYNVARYKKVNVNVADMLQAMVDETNSCQYLFSYYGGTNLDIKNLNTTNVTSMFYMFLNCDKLTSLDVSNLITDNVTDMSYMFVSCSQLIDLDLSNFNTSNVTNMSFMFNNCYKLTSITFGDNFDTSKVKNMQSMFSYCKVLKTLDVSNFNTSNVTNMNSMFGNCQTLTNVIFGDNFDTSKVKNMETMFSYCYQLTSLDLSHFDMTNVSKTDSMFYGCSKLTNVILPSTIKEIDYGFFTSCNALTEFTILATEPPKLANTSNCISTATTSIYVPDASVDAYKTATNWSTYADKIKPLSSKGV